MITFGIDPGSLITGYGVIEQQGSKIIHIDNGIIRPKPTLDFSDRLYHIYNEILIRLNEFRPEIIALEDIFVAKNIKSSIKLGHVRGIAMLAAMTTKVKIAEYSPAQVKQAVVGIGNASKHQVQQMVKSYLKLPEIASEDASDALAVAICHLHSYKMKKYDCSTNRKTRI